MHFSILGNRFTEIIEKTVIKFRKCIENGYINGYNLVKVINQLIFLTVYETGFVNKTFKNRG